MGEVLEGRLGGDYDGESDNTGEVKDREHQLCRVRDSTGLVATNCKVRNW